MKQHTTLKQRKEVNIEQWLELLYNLEIDLPEDKNYYPETVNIGQMIEFLGDDLRNINYTKKYFMIIVKNHIVFEGKILCDVLWEAVKYKLKYE